MFDNYSKYDAYEAECEREDSKYFNCEYCGEKFYGEVYYDIDGKYYCEECALDYFKALHMDDTDFDEDIDRDDQIEERAKADLEEREIFYDF